MNVSSDFSQDDDLLARYVPPSPIYRMENDYWRDTLTHIAVVIAGLAIIAFNYYFLHAFYVYSHTLSWKTLILGATGITAMITSLLFYTYRQSEEEYYRPTEEKPKLLELGVIIALDLPTVTHLIIGKIKDLRFSQKKELIALLQGDPKEAMEAIFKFDDMFKPKSADKAKVEKMIGYLIQEVAKDRELDIILKEIDDELLDKKTVPWSTA